MSRTTTTKKTVYRTTSEIFFCFPLTGDFRALTSEKNEVLRSQRLYIFFFSSTAYKNPLLKGLATSDYDLQQITDRTSAGAPIKDSLISRRWKWKTFLSVHRRRKVQDDGLAWLIKWNSLDKTLEDTPKLINLSQLLPGNGSTQRWKEGSTFPAQGK